MKTNLEKLRDRVAIMGAVFLTPTGWKINYVSVELVLSEIDKLIDKERSAIAATRINRAKG